MTLRSISASRGLRSNLTSSSATLVTRWVLLKCFWFDLESHPEPNHDLRGDAAMMKARGVHALAKDRVRGMMWVLAQLALLLYDSDIPAGRSKVRKQPAFVLVTATPEGDGAAVTIGSVSLREAEAQDIEAGGATGGEASSERSSRTRSILFLPISEFPISYFFARQQSEREYDSIPEIP